MKVTLSAVVLFAALPLATLSWGQDAPRSSSSSGHAADNTGINARDRSDASATSSSQSNSDSDVKLAAAVRRSLTKDSSLSVSGHNVKVMARNGAVTLRGPVKDDDERARIEARVRSVEGVSDVTNELEIKP